MTDKFWGDVHLRGDNKCSSCVKKDEKIEKLEKILSDIGENPDFGSLLSVVEQRNEEIYRLQEALERISRHFGSALEALEDT